MGVWLSLDRQGPAVPHAAGIEAGDDILRGFLAGFVLLKAGQPGGVFGFLG